MICTKDMFASECCVAFSHQMSPLSLFCNIPFGRASEIHHQRAVSFTHMMTHHTMTPLTMTRHTLTHHMMPYLTMTRHTTTHHMMTYVMTHHMMTCHKTTHHRMTHHTVTRHMMTYPMMQQLMILRRQILT